MAVYKDNATGTWRVIYRFTNWKGERKQKCKRGFATKYENMYNLGTDGGIIAIRYFIRILKQYFDIYNPQWLAICPAKDKEKKRTAFYQKILNQMG